METLSFTTLKYAPKKNKEEFQSSDVPNLVLPVNKQIYPLKAAQKDYTNKKGIQHRPKVNYLVL